jgi:hypothetical protein
MQHMLQHRLQPKQCSPDLHFADADCVGQLLETVLACFFKTYIARFSLRREKFSHTTNESQSKAKETKNNRNYAPQPGDEIMLLACCLYIEEKIQKEHTPSFGFVASWAQR